jgi:hypothetical protein
MGGNLSLQCGRQSRKQTGARSDEYLDEADAELEPDVGDFGPEHVAETGRAGTELLGSAIAHLV